MPDIEFCPECGAPVVGEGPSLMCTDCGLMYDEMEDLLDDDIMEDDELDPDDSVAEDDEYDSGDDSDGDGDDW